MLAMLEPVQSTSKVEYQSPTHSAKAASPSVPGDTITPAKKSAPIVIWIQTALDKIYIWMGRTPHLKWVRDHAIKIFNWVKYHVFFLFYDEGEDTLKRHSEKLNNYLNLFFEEAAEEAPAGRDTLLNEFGKLEPELQTLIKGQIYEVLKEDDPQKQEGELQSQVQKVLANPFISFDVIKPNEQPDPLKQKGPPMGRAIIAAILKLSEHK